MERVACKLNVSQVNDGPSSTVLMQQLASPHLTLLGFVLLGLGALFSVETGADPTWLTAGPLALLALNLLAVLLVNQRILASLPLLLLHMSLLAILLLLLAIRLTYFDGHANLTVGAEFDGDIVGVTSGPLSLGKLNELSFTNEGFTEDFPQDGKYVSTYNRVSWRSLDGLTHEGTIGDATPLTIGTWRIHTTASRGFSPVFLWRGVDGTIQRGTVQLPDGLNRVSFKRPRMVGDAQPVSFAETQHWVLPDGTEVWALLERSDSAATRGLVSRVPPHVLVLRTQQQRWELQPGDSIELPGGKLTYESLDAWMGYRIVHDPFTHWLLAACLLAVISLGWHYWQHFSRLSWESNGG